MESNGDSKKSLFEDFSLSLRRTGEEDKMAKKSLLAMGVVFLMTLVTVSAWAEVPSSINYQGKLTDSDRNPLTGTYEMTFFLLDAPTNGTIVWSENHPSVTVSDGIYNVQLGSVSNPFTPNLFVLYDELYLEVQIGSETLVPPQPVTCTPFSMKAAVAETVLDGAVTTVMIADSAVDTQKVADSAITSGKIASNAITSEKIADGAVTAADILDGPGSGLDADTLDGLDSTAFGDITGVTAGTGLTGGGTSGTVTLNLSTPLSLTGSISGGIIQGTNTFATTGQGVYGYASGSSGRGVFGEASNAGDVTNYGGYFTAAGTSGRGVYGIATGTSGTGVQGQATNTGDFINYGGTFFAAGKWGRGVYGQATGTNGNGVYGYATGPDGKGVQGQATNTGDVENFGGYFRAAGTSGRGVVGEAPGTSGRGVQGNALNTGDVTNYGGYFEARGTYGRGVSGIATGSDGYGAYGEASNTGNGPSYGGYFTAASRYGRGVYGEVSGPSGIGVYGDASNTGDYQNYGGFFTAAGTSGRAVYAVASNTGGDNRNYGGYFIALGSSGRAVYGEASGSSGDGVYGYAPGTAGIGVTGFGDMVDFYAAGPGTNYFPFTGAHEVRFAQDFPENIQPGMIVSVTGRAEARTKENGEIALSSTLPTVTLAKKAMDKAVLGVLVSQGSLRKDHWYEAQDGERFGAVNALGEGRMWVTNKNGDIEAGDYITSSDIPGYGQRQDDDLVHSYTVGKAIETVDWDAVTETVEYQGRQVKIYLIAVVYTSG